MTSVRIPGKVMLSGEYAVLYGGTAAMAPVPRFLQADAATNTNTLTMSRAMASPIPGLTP